jgi:rod shape-determining protein MreB
MSRFQFQFSPILCLDFGSDHVRLWYDGKLIVDEPSLVARDLKTGKVLGVGKTARELRHRLSDRTSIIAPVSQGKLVDTQAAAELLRVFFTKALKGQFFSPTVVVSLPAVASTALSQSYTELLYDLGAKEVIGVAQPLAAAIGAGVPVADSSGGLVAVLGGGVMEVSVVALGSMVAVASSDLAGQWLIENLQQQVAKTAQITIGQDQAQQLLEQVAAMGSEKSVAGRSLLLTGKSQATGAPEEVVITAAQLLPPIQTWVAELERLITELLRQLPPELTVDVVTKGLLLAGGLGQLAGLEAHLVKKLGIPVATVELPAQAVSKGLATIGENLDEYKQSLAYETTT